MTSIRIIFLILIAIFSINSCNKNNSTIVEIEGIGNDTIIIEYMPISDMYSSIEPNIDTVYSNKGRFVIDIKSDKPLIVFAQCKKGFLYRKSGRVYSPQTKAITLFIKPNEGNVVKGKLHPYYIDYTVEGTKENEQYSSLRTKYIKEVSVSVKMELQIDSLIFENADKELINKLFKKAISIRNIRKQRGLEVVKKNPNQEISAYYLANQRFDTLGKYYKTLSEGVRNGLFKGMLDNSYLKYKKYIKVIESEKNIVVGKIAPNFSLMDINGQEFSLNSIEDKVIVLDFWGSWCGWCIKGFPRMKEYYNKYKINMEFIGIACGDTEEIWKKSVEKHQLGWFQVINDETLEKDVSVMYGVESYPTKIIIDKDKKILAKFVGESDSFYNKLDEIESKKVPN